MHEIGKGTQNCFSLFNEQTTANYQAINFIMFYRKSSCLFCISRLWDYMKHNHAITTYNHHTEFVCGLDLSLHSNTKVQYNPHYRLSVLNFVLFKSVGPDGAMKYLQET